jgi:hypothetical protein
MASVTGDASERLFSYWTLCDPQVQLASFGRLPDGEPDVVVGYRLQGAFLGLRGHGGP